MTPVVLLLVLSCDAEPECGEGWDLDRFLADRADLLCTMLERCEGGDYGFYEGPDHDGCVLKAETDYLASEMPDQEREECGDFSPCDAQTCIEQMQGYVADCMGEWTTCPSILVYDPGCESIPVE